MEEVCSCKAKITHEHGVLLITPKSKGRKDVPVPVWTNLCCKCRNEYIEKKKFVFYPPVSLCVIEELEKVDLVALRRKMKAIEDAAKKGGPAEAAEGKGQPGGKAIPKPGPKKVEIMLPYTPSPYTHKKYTPLKKEFEF